MRKPDFKKLALQGLATGLLVGNHLLAATPASPVAAPASPASVPARTTSTNPASTVSPSGPTVPSVPVPSVPTPTLPSTPVTPSMTSTPASPLADATPAASKKTEAPATKKASDSADDGSGDSLLKKMENAEGGNLDHHLFTDDEMKLELSPDGLKLYNSLTPEGQRLARIVASTSCDGTNECKGLNSCKSDKNDCAGKGQCKGQSKCAIATKDLAVKLVADKMAKKRAEALNSAPAGKTKSEK